MEPKNQNSLKGSILFKADTENPSLKSDPNAFYFSGGDGEFAEFVAYVAEDVFAGDGNDGVSEDLDTTVTFDSIKAVRNQAQVRINVTVENVEKAREAVAPELGQDVEETTNMDILNFVGESISINFDEADREQLYEVNDEDGNIQLVTEEELETEYGPDDATGDTVDVVLKYSSAKEI
jgi:hypothetical protein